MRVLIAVGHAGIYSGASFQAYRQLIALKKMGLEAAGVWAPDEKGNGSCFDPLIEAGVPLYLLPIHTQPTLTSTRSFRTLLKNFKPDVVECMKSGPQYHALYSGIGLHDHALIFYRGVSRKMDVWQGFKYGLSRVDKVIANCHGLKDVMSKTGRIPADKIEVVYGEYVISNSDPEAVDAEGLKEELGIPDRIPLLTQLGNWSTWRGQDVTLKAARQLKSENIPFHLLFCGNDTDKLQHMVNDFGLSDVVTLSPFRRDPECVLKITDIAINSSTSHESLSGSLINAQVMGLPAVSSRFVGADEIVKEEETGYLVPIGDAPALANGLKKLLSMDRGRFEQMGKKARELALLKFSSEAKTKRRLEVYEMAIKNRRSV